MVGPKQGDIYWVETEQNRRPVLVVTRTQAVPVLNRLIVAPITRTIRGIPTEISLDSDQGLRDPSAASFDNLELVPRVRLTEKLGSIPNAEHEICRALGAMADC
ncbi:MAG: type II toxin-antitoxin system PemK/MazF family toxin [Actinomycetota bacterium]|nr:type II toxin-antitoxin system PemK/MazF family toxin [Actinomycetota bacterium]